MIAKVIVFILMMMDIIWNLLIVIEIAVKSDPKKLNWRIVMGGTSLITKMAIYGAVIGKLFF